MTASRWTYEENNMLLEHMMKDYEYLTSAVTPNKTKAMVDKKWDEIASGINALGVGASLTTDQVKKKWFNLKSKSKKSVAKYKAELKKTGGGSNGAEKPSNMQFRVAEIIGGVYANGVPGTTTCDTSVSSEGIIEEKSSTNSPTSSTESGCFLILSPSRQDDNEQAT